MGKVRTTEAYFNLFERFIYYNVGDHSIVFFAKLTAQRKNVKGSPNILIQLILFSLDFLYSFNNCAT